MGINLTGYQDGTYQGLNCWFNFDENSMDTDPTRGQGNLSWGRRPKSGGKISRITQDKVIRITYGKYCYFPDPISPQLTIDPLGGPLTLLVSDPFSHPWFSIRMLC